MVKCTAVNRVFLVRVEVGEPNSKEITRQYAELFGLKAWISTLKSLKWWRLTYNAIKIPDFTKIEGITIIRED